MESGADAGWGAARVAALVLGVGYLAAAVTESVTQDRLTPMLGFAAPLNGLHWAIGAVFLMAALTGSAAVARTVERILGVALLALALFGIVARVQAGDLLGFEIGVGLPGGYDVIHGATALLALAAGMLGAGAARGGPKR